MAQKRKQKRSLKQQTKQKHNGNDIKKFTAFHSSSWTPGTLTWSPGSWWPKAAEPGAPAFGISSLLLVHGRSGFLCAWVETQECDTEHWPCTVRAYYQSLPFPTNSTARWKSAIKHTKFNQGGMKSAVCTNSVQLTGKPYGPLGPGSPTVPFSP